MMTVSFIQCVCVMTVSFVLCVCVMTVSFVQCVRDDDCFLCSVCA